MKIKSLDWMLVIKNWLICSITAIFRDTPTEIPRFVVEKRNGCGVITPVATDLFDLIRFTLLTVKCCVHYCIGCQ